MKRKAVFVSVLQIQSTGEKRYNGYAAKKGLRIFTSMRDYLATEEESFLSLMFQSYCNFTIALINTRYVLLPHRKNRTPPPPPSSTMVATTPPKQPGEAGHVPPVPPLETQRSCYNSSKFTSCRSWNTRNQSLYLLANRRNVKPSSISLSRQTMSSEILGMKCVT